MLKETAIIQTRVVGALVLREIRVRYGRSQAGYLWAILEPLVFVAAISAMFTLMGSHGPFGRSMALFIALGILPFFLYRNLGNQLGAAFDANQALLNFPIVKEIDTVIARAILEIATTLIVMTLVLSLIVLIDDAPPPDNLLRMMTALLGLSMLGFGVGLSNAVLISKFNSWSNIYKLTSMPFLWISGIFYSLESLPPKIREILVWNPIIHGVEAMRDGYFMNYRNSFIDLPYLFWFGLIATLIGLAAERAIRIRKS